MEKTKVEAIEKMFTEKKARKKAVTKKSTMSDIENKKKPMMMEKPKVVETQSKTEKPSKAAVVEKKSAVKKEASKTKGMSKLSVSFLAVAMFIIGAFVGYVIFQSKINLLEQVMTLDKDELVKTYPELTVSAVGKILELPNEEPVLTIVTDSEKNSGQSFFANAQNGDKVLMYTSSNKAVLFRPGSNKIINVAQIPGTTACTTEQASEVAQSNELETTAKVSVYNGSRTSGLAKRIGEIVDKFDGAEVIEKTNAVGDYEKTIVIDLSGTHPEMAQKIAQTLSGEVVVELPAGEKKPEADILVIGGSGFNAN